MGTADAAGSGRGGGSAERTPPWVVHFDHHELIIRQRYEVISILNDLLIGTWFIIGSIFFFFDSLTYAGTWLFVMGSIEMLIRPTIRLARRIHLQRLQDNVHGTGDAAHDAALVDGRLAVTAMIPAP